MKLVMTCAAILIISVIEVSLFLRNRWKKELWVYVILMLMALSGSILDEMNSKIPSPIEGIRWLYAPINHAINHYFS